MKIDHNSYGTLAIVYAVSLLIVLAVFHFGCSPWVKWPVTAVFAWFCGWQTCFFRVPKRIPVGDDKIVTAVADGKVVILEKVFEPECLKRECIQISIYMNFWDVHANFWPVTGEVTYHKYYPGAHHLAFKPKASEENEHTCTCIRTPGGQDVFFKQISGTFARRIVSYAKPGLQVRAGEQCGIIKFGSRIDMYVPLDAEITTDLDFEPRACESVIAKLR